MCIGRAIIRQAKILVMDEATASLDFNTGMHNFSLRSDLLSSVLSLTVINCIVDALIKQTVRECFASQTLITIAHRLDTIVCHFFSISFFLFFLFFYSTLVFFLSCTNNESDGQ